MCNQYSLRASKAEISKLFGADVPAGANFGEEVFPNYPGLVTNHAEARVMNWGFPVILRGKHGQKLKPKPVNNARDDKLHTPFWRASFEQRRCLIPVNRWAEPQGEAGRMTATWYALPGGEPFAVAGIWQPTCGVVLSLPPTNPKDCPVFRCFRENAPRPERSFADHARFLLEELYTDAQGRHHPSRDAAFSGLLAAIPGLAERSAFVLDPRDIA